MHNYLKKFYILRPTKHFNYENNRFKKSNI